MSVQQVIRSLISGSRTVAVPQRNLSPQNPVIIKAFSQSERKREIGASRRLRCRIRLAVKCFHGRRSRGGFNGRLRGFRWIISGGTKKRRSVTTAPPRRRGAVLRRRVPLGVKSRDKEGRLHDYTVGYARYADNPTADWPFANEPG